MSRKFWMAGLLVALLLVSAAACRKIETTPPESLAQTVSSEGSAELASTAGNSSETESMAPSEPTLDELEQQMQERYASQEPQQWGEQFEGICSSFETDEKEIALTMDACGGPHGSGFDEELISFLREEQISATLFINRKWIEQNKELFLELAADPLFEIENHGYEHSPLCVIPKSVYGIDGTGSIRGALDEIKLNEQTIFDLTGKRTRFFRSGTAYYDEIAVAIAKDLGYQIGGFSVNADAGATFSPEQIQTSMNQVKPGDLIICHFNQPQKLTFEGMKPALLKLKNEGYRFLKLEEAYPLS